MKIHRLRALLAATLAGLLLAGCFGGGGDDDDEGGDDAPPASASRSSEGFLAYIASLADGMFDTAEPLDLERFSAPTDDVDDQEPRATPVDG